MSSFTGKLEIESKNYTVVNFEFSVHREVDFQGRVASRSRHALIEMEIVVPEDDYTFFKWFTNNEVKTGTFKFDKIDQASTFNQVKFENSHCIRFKQNFHDSSPQPMTMNISISVGKITITSGTTEFEDEYFRQT